MYTPTILQPFYQKNKKIKKSLTLIQTQTQSQTQTQTQIHIHSYSTTLSSSAIGSKILIIGRNDMVCYNTWFSTVIAKSAMLFPCKKFTTAIVSIKIYAAGDGSRTNAVEKYDPNTDTWCVEVSYGEGANGGVVFLGVFGICGFGGFLVGIITGVSEIVRFNFFFIHLKFSQETNKEY